MAKITIIDEKGNTMESDAFMAVTLEKEDKLIYARVITSLDHLDVQGCLIIASALTEALNGVIIRAVSDTGVELLYDKVESTEEQKEGDDGDS